MKISHIPWIVCLVLLGGLCFYFWRAQVNAEALLSVKNKELMTANLTIGRAQTTITSQKKAHATAMQNLDKLWKEEIKARKGAVTAYGELEALYKAEKKKRKTITKIVYKDREIDLPDGDIFYKDENEKYQKLTSLKYSYQDFRITIQGDALKKEISYKLHQKFKAQFVASKLPSGAVNHYAEIYEIGPDGKKLDKMELTSFEVIKAEDLPERFMWWNPKIDLMVGGALNSTLKGSLVADIGISIMARGKTPDDITWRFLRLGTGLTQNGFSMTVSPVQLNLGKFLPLISNFWFTPFGGYDFGAPGGMAGAGFSVVF